MCSYTIPILLTNSTIPSSKFYTTSKIRTTCDVYRSTGNSTLQTHYRTNLFLNPFKLCVLTVSLAVCINTLQHHKQPLTPPSNTFISATNSTTSPGVRFLTRLIINLPLSLRNENRLLLAEKFLLETIIKWNFRSN